MGLPRRLRIAARLLAMAAALLIAVAGFYLWRLRHRRPDDLCNPWPGRLLGRLARIAGVCVRTRGAPRRQGAVLLANHVSWLDILALAGETGTAFVAHSGLAEHSLLARLCAMNDTVFVARGERASVAAQVRQVREALSHHRPLTIFVEGTTSDGIELLPFKSALLSALDPPPSQVMVQPVWLDYGPQANAVAWFGDEPGLANVFRILSRAEPVPLTIHFLEPFDPAAAGSRKAIAATARAEIEAALRAARRGAG